MVARRDFLKVLAVGTGAVLLAACTSQTQPAATGAPSPAAPSGVAPTKVSEATPAAPSQTTPTKVSEATPAGAKKGPLKFSYLRPVFLPPTHQKGSAYEQELFRRANVEIESQTVPAVDYVTKLPTLIAGGTMADVMWVLAPNWGPAHDLIEQGAFLPLNEYLGKYPAVRDAIGDALWNVTRSEDGKNYFFPNPLAPYVPFPISYRTDIYHKLNLKEPGSLPEWIDQLKTIRDKMPGVIPLTGQAYILWSFQNVGVSFGYAWNGWVPDEGQPEENPTRIVPAWITKAHRDFMAFMQMLRKEKLIDPDYMVSATGLQGGDKFRAGKAVCMVGHWGGLADDNYELRKAVSDGDISFMKQLSNTVRPMGAFTLPGFGWGFCVSIKAKDRADDIFAFLNWVYTDGYEFMTSGVEGKTYKVTPDGTKVSIPDSEREPGWQFPNIEPFGFPPKTADTWPKWKDLKTTYADRGVKEKLESTIDMYRTAAANAMPNWGRPVYSKTDGQKGTQLFQQYLKPIEKVAIDPSTPLSFLDDQVKLWLDNGGRQIIEEINQVQKDKTPFKPKYEVPADL